ncbi:hypothetical protein [Streptomyces sp. NPDC005322]|uniref:hypothetical protein n=1 Tax=Streptomyces sp. NPDC005322 TaxID=3157032 RepID=UPI0033AE74FC
MEAAGRQLKQFPLGQGSDLEQAYPVVVVGFHVGHEAGMGTGLEALATEAGLEVFRDRRLYHSSGDVSKFIGETIAFVGAAGGLAGIAAVLKAFFERHNGKRVMFGENGHVLKTNGLTAEEIVSLLETLRANHEAAQASGDHPLDTTEGTDGSTVG